MYKAIAVSVTTAIIFLVAGRAQQPAPLHALKIVAGPAGVEEKGNFRLTEERSTFSRSSDREVIVFFQWDGVAGPHKLVARWRSPDGSFTSDSAIDYVARDRKFGAYWRISVTPGMQLGTWSIEATVDGQPGGRFTFEITDLAPAASTPVKRPLSQAELHERLTKDFVVLVRFTADGRELEPAAAVVGAAGQVFTTVKVLDAVERVRGVFSDGSRQELPEIVEMSRSGGWAVLAAGAGVAPKTPKAGDPPRVGDRCYSMQGASTGARILLEGQITGVAGGTPDGAGWLASFVNGNGTSGAPVVNEFGETIGVLAGGPLTLSTFRRDASVIEFGNIPMMPIDGIKPRGAAPASFAELRARGDLLAPLVLETHIVSGGFALGIGRGPIVRPDVQREEFSMKDKTFVVFVTWSPRDRLKGQVSFHVYDSANRLIGSSTPKKVDLRRTDLALSSWKIPVIPQPGLYRAEVHMDGKAAWRGYVRITP